MTFSYLDAHTHVQFPIYDADRDAVLARAREAGVRMVNVGTTRKTSEAAVALAHAYPDLCYAAVGVHPSHAVASDYIDPNERAAEGGEIFDVKFYGNIAGEKSVVAIGECGLDYYRVNDEATKQKQRDLFLAHIKFSKEVGKPLMMHCRETPSPSRGRAAFPDLIQSLVTSYQLLSPENPGIIHFFAGTLEEAQDLLALGFSFTFGGVITFTHDYDDIVRAIPSTRILSETDAPYVTPAPYRGKRNEPSYVVEVVRKLAELKGVPVKKMAEIINENARRIFHI